MKLDTDLIKRKQFAAAIDSRALKHSQEYRVLATLRYLFPNQFENMVAGEAPDLQDTVHSIGIEVTCAANKKDMKVDRLFSDLRQGKCENIEKIQPCGYSVSHIPGGEATISTTGTSDGEKAIFQKSIRRKNRKIYQYRRNFNKIGLAILFTEPPTTCAEDHFLRWALEVLNESENNFDFIYVIAHRFCIYYDVKQRITDKQSLTDNEWTALSTIGRMTAEGELSLTDLEWL